MPAVFSRPFAIQSSCHLENILAHLHIGHAYNSEPDNILPSWQLACLYCVLHTTYHQMIFLVDCLIHEVIIFSELCLQWYTIRSNFFFHLLLLSHLPTDAAYLTLYVTTSGTNGSVEEERNKKKRQNKGRRSCGCDYSSRRS